MADTINRRAFLRTGTAAMAVTLPGTAMALPDDATGVAALIRRHQALLAESDAIGARAQAASEAFHKSVKDGTITFAVTSPDPGRVGEVHLFIYTGDEERVRRSVTRIYSGWRSVPEAYVVTDNHAAPAEARLAALDEIEREGFAQLEKAKTAYEARRKAFNVEWLILEDMHAIDAEDAAYKAILTAPAASFAAIRIKAEYLCQNLFIERMENSEEGEILAVLRSFAGA